MVMNVVEEKEFEATKRLLKLEEERAQLTILTMRLTLALIDRILEEQKKVLEKGGDKSEGNLH